MNTELRELYQTVIIDHGKNPRNFHILENPTHFLDGYNPLCGDKITLYLQLEDEVITEASFTGSGCAISMASSSLMIELLKGKTVDEAKVLFEEFHAMLTIDGATSDHLGKLCVLSGVKTFPARVKCATLAWHTLLGTLNGDQSPAKTE
jgi:nitrogen fixation NifU-like protein